ncbi:MAG: hypothetical protein WCK47_09060 [bacterium]
MSQAGQAAGNTGGLHNALYKIHMDLHCPEWDEEILKDADIGAMMRMVAGTGTQYLYFFAKDHYGNAYYNTRAGHKHRNLGTRDLLAEAIEEGRKVGVRIMAYYSVIWDNHACEAHSDWTMRNEKGQPVIDVASAADCGKWHYVCHNSPGYNMYAQTMLEEIATGYDIEGFHLDMINLDFGGLSCYCDNCRELFFKETGKELPREPLWDEAWRQFLDFRYRSVERMAWGLRNHIHKFKPGCHVVFNYHGSPGFDWRVGQMPVRHALYSTMSTGETYTPLFGNMYPGMEARYVRNLVPGKAVEMVAWRMNRITDFTVKPLNQLRWEALTSTANGATIMLIDQPYQTGELDAVAYDRVGECFREINAKRDTFKGEPARHVAIYYSQKTRDLYGRDAQERFLLPVMGGYKALSESHYCIDFVFDETVSAEILAQYPVVYLPNVAVMSEAECAMLEKYVSDGGYLAATYDTSLYSTDGAKLPNYQLNRLFGADYADTLDCDTHYLRNIPAPFGDGIDPRHYILQMGQAHRVKATTARVCGDVLDSFHRKHYPGRFYSHNIHPPHRRLADAVCVNDYGKGKVVYLPHTTDGSYADIYEIPEHRKLLNNVVRYFGYEPGVVIADAPLNMEAVILRDGARILVHLLLFNSMRQSVTLPGLNQPIKPSVRMEQPAIFRAKIKVNVPFRSVEKLNPDSQLHVDGNMITILCEDIHEVVIIR